MPTRRPTPRDSVSRRDLMKTGAAATAVAAIAGAVAAPTIIPSSALGNQNRAAPSERITLGFIGLGKQNSGHLGSMVGKRDVQVVGICDVDKTRREHFRGLVDKKYGELERKDYTAAKAYEDYRELLARDDVDGVFIGTPDHWHTAQSIDACKAKKDVYCEKPLTLTIHEAKLLIEAVRKHDRVFQVGSQQRSEGPFRDAAEYVLNGRLGRIKEVFVGIGPTAKPCDLPGQKPHEGLNWDMWLGQAPQREYNEVLCRKGLPDGYPFNPGWRDYREYSGGYVTDWGAHHFDITQWALDMDNSGPVEVIPPDGGGTYGAKLIYRGSPAGEEIVVHHSEVVWDQPRKTNGIRFVGERGELFVDRSQMIAKPDSIIKEKLTASEHKLYRSTNHRENWLQCVKDRRRPICDVEIGSRSVTVCHLVNLAYWHGKKLQWNPRTWEFTGENAAEANKWRSRAQREKYQLPSIA